MTSDQRNAAGLPAGLSLPFEARPTSEEADADLAQDDRRTSIVDDRDAERDRWRGIRSARPTSHLNPPDPGDNGAVV